MNRYDFQQYNGQTMKTIMKLNKISYDDGKEISLNAIQNLCNRILETKKKNVYPMIFIYFIKETLGLRHVKIEFDTMEMQKLRLWCNALRNESDNITPEERMFRSYKIGEEVINYIQSTYPVYK